MLLITRHNERPFEMTAELIHLLESLPQGVAFVNIYGEVLIKAKSTTDTNKNSGSHAGAGLERKGNSPVRSRRRRHFSGARRFDTRNRTR